MLASVLVQPLCTQSTEEKLPICAFSIPTIASSVFIFPRVERSFNHCLALTSVFGNDATLQDLQVVLDLAGISAKAVQEVIVFHEAPLSTVRSQQGLGGTQAAKRVTHNPQHLHL